MNVAGPAFLHPLGTSRTSGRYPLARGSFGGSKNDWCSFARMLRSGVQRDTRLVPDKTGF